MNASSPSNDWPDLLLISTMNRAFEDALPVLATGIADKAEIAEDPRLSQPDSDRTPLVWCD
jgi:hypothetical protein